MARTGASNCGKKHVKPLLEYAETRRNHSGESETERLLCKNRPFPVGAQIAAGNFPALSLLFARWRENTFLYDS